MLSFQDKIKPIEKSTASLSFADKITPIDQPFVDKDAIARKEALQAPLKGYAGYSKGVDESYKSGKEQVSQGYDQFKNAGLNPLKMVEAGITGASGVVNTLFSPLAPAFKPVNTAIDFTAQKVSDNPEVQKFANSGLGNISARVANDTANLMTVASAVGSVVAAAGVKTKPGYSGGTSPIEEPVKTPSYVNRIIEKRTEELTKLDNQYAQLRKASGFSKDNGVASKARVASTDVLDGAVDDNGVIRTKQPGGAVDQYRAMTLDNAENVVKKNLEVEGAVVHPDEVQTRLTEAVYSSGLEGADLKVALNKVKREVAGYKLKADADGNIPLVLLQDAKINMKANYLTPPDVQTYQKAIKYGLKTTIEKNSAFNVSEVNAELSKYLEDISFLERLDGKRVQGGKLGKYFAQISGNIVGGVVGHAVGGPVGSALGTGIGGELASRIKGNAMSRTFNGKTGNLSPKNPILQKAVKSGNQSNK